MPKVTSLPEGIDFDNICPIVYALNMIGQKWKIPILWRLADEGTLGYNELKRGTSLIPLLREFDAWGRQQIGIDRNEIM